MEALTPLPRSFYAAGADAVAPRLLGHVLVRRDPCGWIGGVIVETEAYLANDPACHAFRGMTERNRSMFGPPGHAYVYLIYGMHYCFNTVCGPAGRGEAVLVRAIEPVYGTERMQERRGGVLRERTANGPAKLCQAMDLGRALDGADLCGADGELMVARHRGYGRVRRQLGPIGRSARIGLTKAADWPLRYFLAGSDCVSGGGGRGRAAVV